MIREVDLVSYLPPFLAEFKEIAVSLEAENPEFVLVWNAKEKVLQNEFIETADEYGVSRFEKILNILPAKEDTLESRKARIQARWVSTIPYNLKALTEKLIALCGDSNFRITKDYENYRVELETSLRLFGQVEELERLIDGMLPCNMIVDSQNYILENSKGSFFMAGIVQQVASFIINTEIDRKETLQGGIYYGGFVSMHETQELTAETAKAFLLGGAVQYSSVLSSHEEVTIQ